MPSLTQDGGDIASRFTHLLQPIRDLTKNWDVDVAAQLEEYLAEVGRRVASQAEEPLTLLMLLVRYIELLCQSEKRRLRFWNAKSRSPVFNTLSVTHTLEHQARVLSGLYYNDLIVRNK